MSACLSKFDVPCVYLHFIVYWECVRSLKFINTIVRVGSGRGWGEVVPMKSSCTDEESEEEWCCLFSVYCRFCDGIASFWRRHVDAAKRRAAFPSLKVK